MDKKFINKYAEAIADGVIEHVKLYPCVLCGYRSVHECVEGFSYAEECPVYKILKERLRGIG